MKDNLKDTLNKQQDMMEKYGFVIHNVFPDSEKEILWSHHTHGLKENFNHTDLEIVLPISPQLAGSLLHGMVEQIKEGKSFENKLISSEVIENFDVQLFRTTENDREVIRVILPDANGKFPGDQDCSEVYKNQLDDITTSIS